MYNQHQRKEIIANAARDLSAAIRSGDPHRIAAERNNASNALMAATACNGRGAGDLRHMICAPIVSIVYDKATGEATISRRDPATGRKYETMGNYLDQEETRWTYTAECRETPYKVVWTPGKERKQ